MIYQPVSDFDYYNDESLHGNYQYTTLEQIVTDYMMSMHQDDFSRNTPRDLIIYQAKKGMRELYYDVVREIKVIELELSPALTVTVPPDFVNYVRVSWVDERGLLHPMSSDQRMSTSTAYLQDNNYELLFDDEGCVLTGNGVRDTVETAEGDIPAESVRRYLFYRGAGQEFAPNAPLQNIYTNGRFTLDRPNGLLQFGGEVFGKNIVLEYISDGLYTGCEGRPEADIRIHKFAEKALLDCISYELIKNRLNIPANRIMLARKEYYNSRRIAKLRINAMRKTEMLQAFRGASKWVKS